MTIAVIEDKRLPVARAEDFPRNADAGVKCIKIYLVKIKDGFVYVSTTSD